MINAYYTAKSGLIGNQSSLNVTSNNIANVNTVGFKAQRPNFTDILYTNIEGTQSGEPVNLQNGNGTRLQEAATLYTQGTVTQTGQAYDAAIEGEGFFVVEDNNGTQHFTRAGNFTLASGDDGSSYLASADGEYVLDANMQHIAVGGDGEKTEISPAVVTFKNPYLLTQIGEGKYTVSEGSGEPEVKEDAVVVREAVERSNVDLVTEMQRLLESQRGFGLNAKVIQVADEVEQMANSLRT